MNTLSNHTDSLIAELEKIDDQMSDPERIKILFEVHQQRRRLTDALVQIVRADKSQAKRRAAAYFWGRYPTDDSIVTLASFVKLEHPLVQHYKMRFGGQHPAKESLTYIGHLADRVINTMIETLETTSDEETAQHCAEVIKMSFPSRSWVGKVVLERAIAEQKEPEKRKKLESALNYF